MKVNYIIRIDDGYCEHLKTIKASDLLNINLMFKYIQFILNIVSWFKEVFLIICNPRDFLRRIK